MTDKSSLDKLEVAKEDIERACRDYYWWLEDRILTPAGRKRFELILQTLNDVTEDIRFVMSR